MVATAKFHMRSTLFFFLFFSRLLSSTFLRNCTVLKQIMKESESQEKYNCQRGKARTANQREHM